MKKYFIIFCLLFSCDNKIKNPEIIYKTIPAISQIGSPVNHSIEINNLGKLFTLNSVAWEDSSNWLKDSTKVIIKESNIDTLENAILFNYEITFWDTGKVIIPSHYASISFPDSLSPSIFRTESNEVFISSVFDSTMTTTIVDKPLKEIEFPIQKLKLFASLLLLISIIYFTSLLKTRSSQKSNKRKFFNFNPKLKALNDAKEINLDLPSLEFYSEVSEILRKYFQNNYYIISFEMTSSELKKYFQDKELNILLDQIDQVKFGRKDSSYSEKKDILVLLKKVIRKLL
mgnify:CR=1 FL=1